jgi:hypothetical protein
MHFLTQTEWQSWCKERQIPLRDAGWIRSDLDADQFHITNVPYHRDFGAKVHMARFLFSLVKPEPEMLLPVGDWAVWPSSQHMPLFTRFREALGEKSNLVEAPGHLVATADSDDAVSITE